MPLLLARSLLVTSELSIQEGKVEDFLALVHDRLEVSRNFAGNQCFDIFLDQENPGKVLFIDQWESEQHFQTYYQWRLGQGDFETLGEYFSAPPAMHSYRDLDELRGSE
ncbi:MAG: antibiotic biosynthesis monooxygenase [Proteobacteria bacterium]|nr:antibiotic biosynthesis monooxygenase [Pseudomonadota bacterium]MDA1289344.1 antibiotic biosynthesis monooxygenase [Pseudomonadota bacterium]